MEILPGIRGYSKGVPEKGVLFFFGHIPISSSQVSQLTQVQLDVFLLLELPKYLNVCFCWFFSEKTR